MDSSFLTKRYQHPAPNILAEIGTLAATTKDAIDLSIGDPDFKTPDAVIDASFEKTKQGMTHYTEASGLPELRESIRDYYQDRYGIGLSVPQIRVTVGASHAMFIALAALLNEGDEVIVPEPCFSPYPEEVIVAGGTPVILNTKPEDGFKIKPTAVEALINEHTKAIIINTPNNPTGNVMSQEDAKELAELAKKHDIFIMADEVYSDYLMPGNEFVPMVKYAPENVITLGSFSKSYAMTGWRIGYLIGPEYLTSAARLVNEGITYSAPAPSQNAALYAIQHADEIIPPFAKAFRERLTYIDEQIKQIDWLDVSPIQGSIYAFADIRKTGLNSVDFAQQLLKKAGIIVIPGLAFGEAGEGFIRIAATQPLDVIKTAFDRLKKLDPATLKE